MPAEIDCPSHRASCISNDAAQVAPRSCRIGARTLSNHGCVPASRCGSVTQYTLPDPAATWRRLRESPSGLAVRCAFAEPERGRGSDPIEEGLAASDGVTEPEPGALGRSEVSPVFRLVGVGDAGAFGRVTHLGGVTL